MHGPETFCHSPRSCPSRRSTPDSAGNSALCRRPRDSRHVRILPGAAARRVPVVIDGFIATAAAALAVRLCPAIVRLSVRIAPLHRARTCVPSRDARTRAAARSGNAPGEGNGRGPRDESHPGGRGGVHRAWQRSQLRESPTSEIAPGGDRIPHAHSPRTIGRHSTQTAWQVPSGWFPLVGALLGAIYSLAAALLKGHLPASVIAVLIVLLDALLTGALHFDGLADTADGFGGGATREDILRIMRDHAIGTYGGVAW